MTDERPGVVEASAAAFAGAAFAVGAFVVRSATLAPPGLFDGAAIVSAAWGASLWAHRATGAVVGTLARGIGLAVGVLVATISLVPPFDGAALPLALWILGGALLQARASTWRAAFVATGVALLATGGALAWAFAGAWPEPARLRAAIAASGLLAGAGLLALLVLRRRLPTWAPSPLGVLLFAALASTYVAYRPLVATRVANLPLYEWTLGVGAAALMLAKLRRSARDASVGEAWSGEGRKHRPDATAAYDPRLVPLAMAIDRYLDKGDGFEDYRAALLRLAPRAPPPFRKALQGARPVQGRGRARKSARRERLATHAALMELIEHGHPAPDLRTHP